MPLRRRGVGAEGNVKGPHGGRAQDRATPSAGIDRVREVAREKKGERFTTLLHHIDATLLRQAYFWLKRDAAPGVDGMTWDAYGDGLDARLRELESRIHLGQRFVNASCNRRNAVLVPTGHSRAFVPTFRNLMAGSGRWGSRRWRTRHAHGLDPRVVQRAVVEVLNAIYEQDFVGFSYGFRPPRLRRGRLPGSA
jgi:RNA-directed DNA polymerase